MKTYNIKYTDRNGVWQYTKIKATTRFNAKMEMTELDPFASNIRIMIGEWKK